MPCCVVGAGVIGMTSHHLQLKELWLVDQDAFSNLSPSDQLALHKYFQFASEKIDIELLEHRRNVHMLDPSLPQRAGRAYARLVRGDRAHVTYAELPRGGRVSVRAVMRPEPDVHLLAKAVRDIALKEMQTRIRRERVLNRATIRAHLSPTWLVALRAQSPTRGLHGTVDRGCLYSKHVRDVIERVALLVEHTRSTVEVGRADPLLT